MSSTYPLARLAAVYALLAVCMAASSQTSTHSVHAAFNRPTDPVGAGSSAVTPVVTKPAPHPHTLTERWLDLTTLSHAERFRSAFAAGGIHNFENGQARSIIEGRFKLDPQGRYAIGFRASSGRYFNWAYSNYTGPGFIERVASPAALASEFTPEQNMAIGEAVIADPAGFAILATGIQSNGWEFYMRELNFSATPIKAVTVEFGSMGIERGYSSEITTFDEDGYISGERVRIHDPKHLFFDEIGFTNGYFGDFDHVNLFDRGSSLKKFNYRQVTAKKRLNKQLAFSGEYTWQTGISTLREAVVMGVKPSKVLDNAKVEVYERVNSKTLPGLAVSPFGPIQPETVDGASGFAITVDKKWGGWVETLASPPSTATMQSMRTAALSTQLGLLSTETPTAWGTAYSCTPHFG